VKKEDLVDLITAHKGFTVCKYKERNLGPVAGFRALIIIIAKNLYVMSNLNKSSAYCTVSFCLLFLPPL